MLFARASREEARATFLFARATREDWIPSRCARGSKSFSASESVLFARAAREEGRQSSFVARASREEARIFFSLALRAMRVGFLLFRPRFARGGSNIHFCSLALRTRRLEMLFPIVIHFFRSRGARGGSRSMVVRSRFARGGSSNIFVRSRYARGGSRSICVARAARDEAVHVCFPLALPRGEAHRNPFSSLALRAMRLDVQFFRSRLALVCSGHISFPSRSARGGLQF